MIVIEQVSRRGGGGPHQILVVRIGELAVSDGKNVTFLCPERAQKSRRYEKKCYQTALQAPIFFPYHGPRNPKKTNSERSTSVYLHADDGCLFSGCSPVTPIVGIRLTDFPAIHPVNGRDQDMAPVKYRFPDQEKNDHEKINSHCQYGADPRSRFLRRR